MADDQGKVLFSSRRIWLGTALLDDRSEFDSERFTKAQQDRRLILDSGTQDDHIIAYQPVSLTILPGEIRSSRVGVLLLDYSLLSAKTNIKRELWDQGIIYLSISAIAMSLMMLALQYWLSRPLNYLRDVVKRISQGDFSTKVDIYGKGELAELASSVNKMQIDLANAQSESQRSIEMLSARETELESKNAELERFTYTVSHDLKSPLVTITGFIGLLGKDIADNKKDRVESDLIKISDAAKTMQHLLDDLLELSRIGRQHRTRVDVSVESIVTAAVKMLDHIIENTQTKIIIEAELPVIHVEEARFKEVYLNLIENAIKYKRDGVTPEITVGIKHNPYKNNEVIFFVKDNGMGIEAVYHDKIFSLFERLSNNNEGTGVGLAIVKRIIEVHDGRVWVESEGIGQGSTFNFVINMNNSK